MVRKTLSLLSKVSPPSAPGRYVIPPMSRSRSSRSLLILLAKHGTANNFLRCFSTKANSFSCMTAVSAGSNATNHSSEAASVGNSSTEQDEHEMNNYDVIHCSTCTCQSSSTKINSFTHQEVEEEAAAPKWSFHKRVLPNTPSLLAFSSEEGKMLFRETLLRTTPGSSCEAYFPLSEQFMTQSEPAYCGLSTLAMVLNALSIDPNVRWRGGWRWFDEQVLIHACCIHMETVKRVGVTLDQLVAIARCNGAKVFLRRPQQHEWKEDNFRNEIRNMSKQTNGFLIVSFSREALGQTGEGHFSPVAAYHEERDMALILDVARFKYSPYWVKVSDLYQAMIPPDGATDKPRGWCLVYPQLSPIRNSEKQRPGELVANASSIHSARSNNTEKRAIDEMNSASLSFPNKQTTGICPVGEIKVEYCPTKNR